MVRPVEMNSLLHFITLGLATNYKVVPQIVQRPSATERSFPDIKYLGTPGVETHGLKHISIDLAAR